MAEALSKLLTAEGKEMSGITTSVIPQAPISKLLSAEGTGMPGITNRAISQNSLSKLLTAEGTGMPGITTSVIPQDGIFLEENTSGRRAKIGVYAPPEQEKHEVSRQHFASDENAVSCQCFAAEADAVSCQHFAAEADARGCQCPVPLKDMGCQMRPVAEGLSGLGKEALERCAARPGDEEWVCIDELGYVETGCEPFCDAVHSLLEKKRVLAVLRAQNTPFLDKLRAREDAFIYDLDHPLPPIAAVIMASGLGRRFGGNKLLSDLDGKPLIEYVLEQTQRIFAYRVVVTRHNEIARICQKQNIDCVLHKLPCRSDTVRLGVEFLQRKYKETDTLAGYLFCPSDQPFLTQDSLAAMLLTYAQGPKKDTIFRLSYKGRAGAPVLFSSTYEHELCMLPEGKGGSWLIKKYTQNVHNIEALSQWELQDIDTPEDLQTCTTWKKSIEINHL